MKKLLFFFVMFGLGIASFAQTDSPTVAPFLKVQWETGFESTWDGNPAFLLSHSTF